MTVETEAITAANNLRGMDAVIPPVPEMRRELPPIIIHVPQANQTLKLEYPEWIVIDTLIFTAIGTYFILLGFIIKGVTL